MNLIQYLALEGRKYCTQLYYIYSQNHVILYLTINPHLIIEIDYTVPALLDGIQYLRKSTWHKTENWTLYETYRDSMQRCKI